MVVPRNMMLQKGDMLSCVFLCAEIEICASSIATPAFLDNDFGSVPIYWQSLIAVWRDRLDKITELWHLMFRLNLH